MDLFLTGAFAGLALAIPLGPMAILLISTTIKHGRGIGVFGALAMATVDFCYAAVVFAFGNLAISLLTDWLFPMRLAGSLILTIVAVRIFLDARKSSALNKIGNFCKILWAHSSKPRDSFLLRRNYTFSSRTSFIWCSASGDWIICHWSFYWFSCLAIRLGLCSQPNFQIY
jgi:hypothetical protein